MTSEATTREINKAIVSEMYERLNRGDLSVLDDHPGLAETRLLQPRLRAAFPDLTGTIEQLIAEGDRVAVHLWLEGTHGGDFAGIAATGKRVRYQVVAIDRLEDGKIVQHNAAPDLMGVLMQLGALSIKPVD